METLSLFFLVAVAIGGAAWVFIYPLLSGEHAAEKRRQSVTRPTNSPQRAAAAARTVHRSRREQVEGSLKELEQRQAKNKSPPLQFRIAHAGLNWSKKQFIIISVVMGVVAFFLFLLIDAGLMASLAIGFAAGFGFPRWLLGFLKRRRESRFLNAFPDAVDTIVRGIKAGLPLLDSMKMIATDAPEPVRSEFRSIIETQAIGMPIGEACQKLYERVPVPEANFFGIVIAIQQKAGGNLSEALGNLSRVLRDRKKMKAKIQAMSMEAKASASIIAALPIGVMAIVYITSPTYIELLWTTPIGRMMIAGCAMWMAMGVFVMRKMINFDF
jgi:tight adherence protein B